MAETDAISKMTEDRRTIRLRETTDKDLCFVAHAEQSSENRPFILGWSHEQHRKALQDLATTHLIFERLADNAPIGFAVLLRHVRDECVEFRRIVVTSKGHGYGREAVRIIKRLAFEKWHAHRLWLDVMDHNVRARRLYETEGFVVEGVLRDCVKPGKFYRSLVIMSMLSHEYSSWNAKDGLR